MAATDLIEAIVMARLGTLRGLLFSQVAEWYVLRVLRLFLILAILWMAHVLVGSYLKDRRLERSIGEP